MSPETKYDILRAALNQLRTTILLHGPITLYEAQKELKASSTTLGRRLKILVRENELEVYSSPPHWSGQTKKIYGFTFYGFLRSFRIPEAFALKRFKVIMEVWLKQKQFQFFLPNEEALQALIDRETANSLARLCQLTANMFGEAEDFFEDIGYEFSPSITIELALQLAQEQYGRRFFETSRVLCRNLPSYRKRIEAVVNGQQAKLDEFRTAVLGE
jgi:hypothetical protein